MNVPIADLESLPAVDVSTIIPGKRGRAVRLRDLLARVTPPPDVKHVHVVSSEGRFSTSLPLDAAGECLLAFGLPLDEGGPLRLFVPEPKRFGLDPCANVKDVGKIELGSLPGRTTCLHSS